MCRELEAAQHPDEHLVTHAFRRRCSDTHGAAAVDAPARPATQSPSSPAHLGHPSLALRVAIQASSLRLGPIINRLYCLCPAAGTAAAAGTTAAAVAAVQPLAQASVVLVQQRGGLVQDVVRV